MQEDFYPAAEKILSDIEATFKKDPRLKSFEILPVPTNQNKSPVYHVEHCLGLESWCVPHVYCHAYQNVMSLRQNKNKAKDYSRLNTLLMGALIINPAIHTFWNMRRDLINTRKLDPYFELHFTSVILTRKPKTPDIFSHRKWILNKILQDSTEDTPVLVNEMHICELAADRYSNNYHAWTHRLWCLSKGIQINHISFYHQELVWSRAWVMQHVSDYSGIQYRQQLLTKIMASATENVFTYDDLIVLHDENEDVINNFVKLWHIIDLNMHVQTIPLTLKLSILELSFNNELIRNFPGHEALWYHRRFVFNMFKNIIFQKDTYDTNKYWGYIDAANHFNADGVPLEKNQKVDISRNNEKFAMILSIHEEIFLRKFADELCDSREKINANRHKQWLSKFMKFQLPYNLDLLKNDVKM
ncbi:protein prenyltransferase alpha subunit repeat-containing protein tempura [Rhodnius prolixus]